MTASSFQLDITQEIAASPLYAAGGYAVIPGLFSEEALTGLTGEALSVRATGQRNELAVSDGTEGRGGSPARAFATAHGRETQWRLFSAPFLLATLSQKFGLAALPTGSGTYTYYEQAGDFLALHRDIVTCDLAVITCLRGTRTAANRGSLLVYPEFSAGPISWAHAAGRDAATPVPLGCGDTAFLLGGMVPHEVVPMQSGQERIVSVMCYRMAGSSLQP
jgi:hypothetical protein